MHKAIVLLPACAALGILLGARAQDVATEAKPHQLTRINVYTLTPDGDAAEETKLSEVAAALASTHDFAPVAYYSGRVLVKGPSGKSEALLAGLSELGFAAEPAFELDSFMFHGETMDSDIGPVPEKPLDDSGGAYFLNLDGYPREEWLAELQSEVSIALPLGSAAYVVFAGPGKASALKLKFPWVRSVFNLTSDLKKYGFDWPYPDASPFRPVIVRTGSSAGNEALREFLSSVSSESLTEVHDEANLLAFQASISDVDIETVSQFGSVLEILPVAVPTLSAERPDQLIARPGSQTGNGSTLPAANIPKYVDWLQNAGLSITNAVNRFSNTTVGVIDSGFDNGDITYAGIHPDFRYVAYQGSQIAIVIANTTGHTGIYSDREHHGTLVASIIAGYPAASRIEGTNGYQFGLGVAPTVRLVTDKFFNCFVPGGTYQTAISRVSTAGANVVNMSFNDPGSQGGCDYTAGSLFVDGQTRTGGRLFIVAAGNSPEGCANNYVRSPATAKNAIAVGSTDNFTLTSWSNVLTSNTCAWNALPSGSTPQDARRIPSFSARGKVGSVVKPDLVAPSTRVTGPNSRGATACGTNLFCNPNIATFSNPSVTYGMAAGTSFAAPAVTGAAAVVRRWFLDLKGATPSPAMTKAILINGAKDIAGTIVRDAAYGTVATVQHIPDLYQGWGMLSFERLLGPTTNYYFLDQSVSLTTAGEWWEKDLFVTDGAKEIHAALTWSDVPGTAGPTYSVINDINLEVCGPINTTRCWRGNFFGSSGYTPTSPPATIYRDSTNNVERVVIFPGAFPTGTKVTARVRVFNLPQPPQTFAVVLSNVHE